MAHVTIASANAVTSGPPHRVILRLAIPTMIAMLAQSVVNDVDAVLFGRLPCPESENAQAALLPSLILLWIFGGSLSAISVGTQAFTARRFAEGRRDDAGAVLTNAFFFATVAGIGFTLIGYVAMPTLLAALIKNEGARRAASAYLHWRLLGIVSMAATFALKAFFDGIGKTHVHLVASVVMNVLNVALCLILIFGNAALGVKKYGIAGAGMAGFVSTYVGLAVMLGYALLREYRTKFRPFSAKKLDLGLMWPIVKLSLPSGVATIVVFLGFALFSRIAGQVDVLHPSGLVSALCPGGRARPVNAAATGVVVIIMKLTFTACLAFGTSTATLVAQSLGEKAPEKAERFGWSSVRLGVIIFGVVGLLQAIFAKQILAFVSESELVQAAALTPLRMMGILTPLTATGMILTQALFGAGNTRFVMVVELILHFTCLVPLAWLLGVKLDLGLAGCFGAAVLYVLGLSTLMLLKFRSGDWKRLKLEGDAADIEAPLRELPSS